MLYKAQMMTQLHFDIPHHNFIIFTILSYSTFIHLTLARIPSSIVVGVFGLIRQFIMELLCDSLDVYTSRFILSIHRNWQSFTVLSWYSFHVGTSDSMFGCGLWYAIFFAKSLFIYLNHPLIRNIAGLEILRLPTRCKEAGIRFQNYFEVDFSRITRQKIKCIRKSAELTSFFPQMPAVNSNFSGRWIDDFNSVD